MKMNMGMWLVGGAIGAYFLMMYLPRQGPRTRVQARVPTYEGVDESGRPTLYFDDPGFRGTGASEEAYWSGYGEGRHIQVPGRIG